MHMVLLYVLRLSSKREVLASRLFNIASLVTQLVLFFMLNLLRQCSIACEQAYC